MFQNVYHVDLLYILCSGVGSSFHTPCTCLFFFDMAPGNVLCHHNRHLMRYFEFLHGLLIICLLLNIWGKLHWQHLFKKIGEAETRCFHLFIFVNMIQYAHIKKSSIDHSNGDHHYFFIWIPILHQFFSNYIF